MKILLSPAKSLNLTSKLPIEKYSIPNFLDHSEVINKELKKLSPKDISELMKISDNLSELNYTRNQEWKLPFSLSNARQAIYAFDGDVYGTLDAYTIPHDKIDVLQQKLRILSGLYGILKPLDLIQPYRLEMGIKLPVADKKNLYDYWTNILTNFLNSELQDNELVVNLASKEYFTAIDFKKIKSEVVTPIFKDYKNGSLQTIGLFAKKARGAMVRFIIDNDVNTFDELKEFNYDGYRYQEDQSDKNNILFTR